MYISMCIYYVNVCVVYIYMLKLIANWLVLMHGQEPDKFELTDGQAENRSALSPNKKTPSPDKVKIPTDKGEEEKVKTPPKEPTYVISTCPIRICSLIGCQFLFQSDNRK